MGKWAINEKLEPKLEEKFKSFLDLWIAWQGDKSDNLVRLQFRINSTYEGFSKEERIQFTQWMIAGGHLSDPIIRALRTMNGHLDKMT